MTTEAGERRTDMSVSPASCYLLNLRPSHRSCGLHHQRQFSCLTARIELRGVTIGSMLRFLRHESETTRVSPRERTPLGADNRDRALAAAYNRSGERGARTKEAPRARRLRGQCEARR